jgi:hypothetical protein
MFYEYDDGWRICDRCYEGFTIDYEAFDYKRGDPVTNGYCEKADKILCNKCWELFMKENIKMVGFCAPNENLKKLVKLSKDALEGPVYKDSRSKKCACGESTKYVDQKKVFGKLGTGTKYV